MMLYKSWSIKYILLQGLVDKYNFHSYCIFIYVNQHFTYKNKLILTSFFSVFKLYFTVWNKFDCQRNDKYCMKLYGKISGHTIKYRLP